MKKLETILRTTGKLAPPGSEWYVYMIRCKTNALYTGITKDVRKRFKVHQENKGAKYLRNKQPLKLVYQELIGSRSDASKVEYFIKSWTKKEKENFLKNGGKLEI